MTALSTKNIFLKRSIQAILNPLSKRFRSLTRYSDPHARSPDTGHKLTSQQPEYLGCFTSSGTFAIKDRCLPKYIQIYCDIFPVNSYWVNKYLTFYILTSSVMDLKELRIFPTQVISYPTWQMTLYLRSDESFSRTTATRKNKKQLWCHTLKTALLIKNLNSGSFGSH